ncbi:hypothetical protein MNEG_15126 [Monoraphidium neglectum]|uniref:Uncharacterized protein n=1 Tax=Monoraphidium neglectum TaxID=145388 RepID=A0A0D2IY23_9CHLO|nr:hypothetical protein MNEG_15126 [Monoraphidium neglectum]KIY92837.1 hypothetical protein MNEG_15126 [Monoraphidium neglectum]|eukprot:XP_013891857.1 hypothetical protein MNEG_15126 [Monoraphidium neglectum]
MAAFEVAPPAPLLARFCADAGGRWGRLSDAALAGAPAALAAVGAAAPGAGWLEECASEVLQRAPAMAPPLRCRAAWALATLGYAPSAEWLDAFEAAALGGRVAAAAAPAPAPAQDEGGAGEGEAAGAAAAAPVKDDPLAGASAGDALDLVWGLQAMRAVVAAGSSAVAPPPAAPAALRALCARCSRQVGALGAGRLVRLVGLLANAKPPPAAGGAGFSAPGGLLDDISRAASANPSALAAAAAAPGGGGLPRLAWAAAVVELRLANSARDELMRRLYASVAAAVAADTAAAGEASQQQQQQQQQGQMPVGDMARALWSGARLGGRWLPPQLAAFEAATAPRLAALDGAGAALLLRGFALSGHRPSAAWLRAFGAAGLDGSRLQGLGSAEVLSILSALRDASVAGGGVGGGSGGRGAASAALPSVPWLSAWAAALPADEVVALPSDHLITLLQLSAPSSNGDDGAAPSGEQAASGGGDLHGLLCLALSRRLQDLSASELCAALAALARWGPRAPADASLLPALAVRASEKLPALNAAQAAGLPRAFAALGYQPGEPLQSRLCGRLLEGAAQMEPAEAAEVLAAVLTGLEEPSSSLVKALLTGPQLKGPQQLRVLTLSPRGAAALVDLLGAMAARGLEPPPGWLGAAQLALAGCCDRLPSSRGVAAAV